MRNEEVLQSVKERNTLHRTNRRKTNWIGHIMCRNCLLKHVIERKKQRKKERKKDRTEGKTKKKT